MRRIFVVVGCAVAVLQACGGDDSTTSPQDASAPDTTAGDASLVDAAGDVAQPADASDASDAGAGDAAPVYNDITDPSKWASFSIGANVTFAATENQGGTFDGRYVYIVPATTGLVVRYDTTQTFSSASSWTSFDLKAVDPIPKRFAGAVFDGQYVYLTPQDSGRALRYDPSGAFGSAASWSEHDFSKVTAEKTFGGVFDGRYVYEVPNMLGASPATIALRHDTKSNAFADAGSWDSFDLGGVDGGAGGFAGGAFDGRYTYYVPQNGQSPVVARYDTTATFGQAASWSTFDVSAVSPQARDFCGAVFDGRWVVLVPQMNKSGKYAGNAVRYDTTQSFTQVASWEAFDTSTIDASAVGFAGGQFDGRYVYFVPFRTASLGFNSLAVRYDTQGAFTQKASWSAYDMIALDQQAHAMSGAIYDGRFLYYVPWLSGILTRFDTKTPSSLPKPTASFY